MPLLPTGNQTPNVLPAATPAQTTPVQVPHAPTRQQDVRAGQLMQQMHQRLTQQMPFRRAYYKSLQKGALAYFQYLFWQHDPGPLILVTDVQGDRIRGVNLHYLTFKYMKSLLTNYCGKPMFSYQFIKHDFYITSAFRTYKRAGIRNLQLLDCDILNLQFQNQRKAYKYNPQELKSIREQLRKQLERISHPSAEDLANRYVEMLNTQTGFQELPTERRQDARRAYRVGVPYSPLHVPQPRPGVGL